MWRDSGVHTNNGLGVGLGGARRLVVEDAGLAEGVGGSDVVNDHSCVHVRHLWEGGDV